MFCVPFLLDRKLEIQLLFSLWSYEDRSGLDIGGCSPLSSSQRSSCTPFSQTLLALSVIDSLSCSFEYRIAKYRPKSLNHSLIASSSDSSGDLPCSAHFASLSPLAKILPLHLSCQEGRRPRALSHIFTSFLGDPLICCQWWYGRSHPLDNRSPHRFPSGSGTLIVLVYQNFVESLEKSEIHPLPAWIALTNMVQEQR